MLKMIGVVLMFLLLIEAGREYLEIINSRLDALSYRVMALEARR
jgi:hypothetical protein